MGRPRLPIRNYTPAISVGQAAVTVETDMGGQIVTDTFVAGSAGSVNIVLNSLRTSNVIWWFVTAAGQSYHYHAFEVTDPNVSAVFVGLTLLNDTSMLSNRNLRGKMTILQRQ